MQKVIICGNDSEELAREASYRAIGFTALDAPDNCLGNIDSEESNCLIQDAVTGQPRPDKPQCFAHQVCFRDELSKMGNFSSNSVQKSAGETSGCGSIFGTGMCGREMGI